MASMTAAAVSASLITRPVGLSQRRPSGVASSPILGLPAISVKGRVRCSMDGKPSPSGTTAMGTNAALISAMYSAMASAGPAMALVDERMSTEGTGLPFGLSNNLLGWILFGIFGLIWALYFVYTADLEEDEESGLSL